MGEVSMSSDDLRLYRVWFRPDAWEVIQAIGMAEAAQVYAQRHGLHAGVRIRCRPVYKAPPAVQYEMGDDGFVRWVDHRTGEPCVNPDLHECKCALRPGICNC